MIGPALFKYGDYRLKINREGLFLYLILFAIGLAAYNTGNNLLFLFVALIATLAVAHTLLNYFSRQDNLVERQLPEAVFAGEPFPVTLRLTNSKRLLASHSIVLQDECLQDSELPGQGCVHFTRVPPGGSQERRYEACIERRGIFAFDGIWLQCRYPFGFSTNSIRYRVPQQVVVYPRLIPVTSIPDMQLGHYGDRERPEKGFGFSLYGLREYQPGESSRFIHWRTSAKTGQLMIKEFENEENYNVSILFENIGSSLDFLFEIAVSQAASLAAYFLRNGWQVELITLCGQVPLGSGGPQLRRILYHLALIQAVAVPVEEARRELLRRVGDHRGRVVWVESQTPLEQDRPAPTLPPVFGAIQ